MRITIWAASAAIAIAFAGTSASAERYDRNISNYNRVIRAIILGDIAGEREAERDAKRFPYASKGYGPIKTARAARDACAADVLNQIGRGARLASVPVAHPMSTGWEVEGAIDPRDGGSAFVCSVRNGSVSGVLIR